MSNNSKNYDISSREQRISPVVDTYKVATNPELEKANTKWLHVLFSGESQTKPSHKQGPKLYDFYLMHFIVSGKGYFHTEQRNYQLQAGDTFLIRPNELITYEADVDRPWHYYWVAFRGEQAEQLLDKAGFSVGKEVVSVTNIELMTSYYQSIYEAFRTASSVASIKASGLLHLIMAAYGENQQLTLSSSIQPHKKEHYIHKQMVQYLTTQYAHPVSIELMAETLGYNRAYLSRVFKQNAGVSPSTYLLHLRLDQARHLLRGRPELTIEQVSASVGIQDALYFSKQFKKHYQLSPTEYRKKALL